MPFYAYLVMTYLIIMNIATLVMYIKEGEDPSSRLSALALIILPIIGGSLGACIGNFFSDTEYKELRSWLHKFFAFIPPIMFVIHFSMILYIFGTERCFTYVWSHVMDRAGWLGCYLVVINIIGFFLVIIRKLSYYFAPHGNFLIPDLVLIPILIFGGATGGMIAKVLFNFKEDWSCNALMEVQNFVYNVGMFIISAIHIGVYVYFFYIK